MLKGLHEGKNTNNFVELVVILYLSAWMKEIGSYFHSLAEDLWDTTHSFLLIAYIYIAAYVYIYI